MSLKKLEQNESPNTSSQKNNTNHKDLKKKIEMLIKENKNKFSIENKKKTQLFLVMLRVYVYKH